MFSLLVAPVGRFVGLLLRAGSLIWRSRWVTDNGIVECREALVFPVDAARFPWPRVWSPAADWVICTGTSDAHTGLVTAIEATLPGGSLQR